MRSSRCRAASAVCTLDAPPSRWRVRRVGAEDLDAVLEHDRAQHARAAPASAAATRPRRTCPARRAAGAASRAGPRARRAAARDAVTSSHVSCARRCTSYGRLPARSTMAAPRPASGAMPVLRKRSSMKCREHVGGNLAQAHDRPGLVERPARPDHLLHQASARTRRTRSRPGAAAAPRRAAPARRCRR